MTNQPRLSAAGLAALQETEQIDALTVPQLFDLFTADAALRDHMPPAAYQVDPRDGSVVVFAPSRARRPHAYEEESSNSAGGKDCPICAGKTTGVVDTAVLSQGSTFINKNLFPVVSADFTTAAQTAYGLHFLQWTSTYHERDWHNMPLADCVVVMERLAALERHLLFGPGAARAMKPALAGDENQGHGYVSIIKNYGGAVGGSLRHGHQQILYSSVRPAQLARNQAFMARHQETFTDFILRQNPADLMVRDYGPAVLLVPYFMRRPYNMLLIVKNTTRRYLSELSGEEMTAVAQGWQDAIRAIRRIMPRLGKEIAYNIITHNGPGAGFYFEILPYTQETGGFEHLGLWVSHETPDSAAEYLRQVLGEKDSDKMAV